jgi:crotonobetainyl-CoA:carnitine CoA-transferase CaiB-like acyl-CoA transferase
MNFQQRTNRPSFRGLPLEGVRILDFGQIVAGPFCTRLLAWMGAEVILVETRGHDVSRIFQPFAYGRQTSNTSGLFNTLGTNKFGITINMRTAKGVSLARKLARVSDIVVENFATGTMDKMGMGYEELRRQRPDLIMLSLGGFGRSGEMKSFGALHSGVNMVSGLAAITGYPGGRPRIMGSYLPDSLSGLYGCMAILEALYNRQITGQGSYIDLSMSEVLTQFLPEAIFDYSVNGRESRLIGNRDRVHAPQGTYPCKRRDTWVSISITSRGEWVALCHALGCPDMADDPGLVTAANRQAHHDELDTIITNWTSRYLRDDAVRLLQEAGVPAGPSATPKDLLNSPHLKARGFVQTVSHPEAGRRRMFGLPWRISNMAPTRLRRAPLLGEHTAQVLQNLLGMTEQEVLQLSEEQVTY